MVAQVDAQGHLRQRLAANQGRQSAGQGALGLLGEAPQQQVRNNQRQHPVAQELEALIALCWIAGGAWMGQGLAQQPLPLEAVGQARGQLFEIAASASSRVAWRHHGSTLCR